MRNVFQELNDRVERASNVDESILHTFCKEIGESFYQNSDVLYVTLVGTESMLGRSITQDLNM